MKLWEYINKDVRIILNDGTSVSGKVSDWFDGYDIDGEDEIVIDKQSYSEDNIKQIEIIST